LVEEFGWMGYSAVGRTNNWPMAWIILACRTSRTVGRWQWFV